MTNATLYVPIVILSTQDNAKLFKQLNLGYKRAINWNTCLSKKSSAAQNYYLKMKMMEQGIQDFIFQK